MRSYLHILELRLIVLERKIEIKDKIIKNLEQKKFTYEEKIEKGVIVKSINSVIDSIEKNRKELLKAKEEAKRVRDIIEAEKKKGQEAIEEEIKNIIHEK